MLSNFLLFIIDRERTKIVYRAFGRGTVAELYRSLVDLKVTYFVLQDHWCYGESRYVSIDFFNDGCVFIVISEFIIDLVAVC
jgi:hypothetical protein